MTCFRKLTIWMVLSAATVSAAFAYFHFWHQRPPRIENATIAAPTGPWQNLFDSGFPAISSRPVYPHSVIPGGVSSVAELRQILADNPQLAAHLKNFDLNRAVLVRSASPRAAYVSYRTGNLIFWTARKLTIARGEALITDGKRTIRGRCGNDISDVPQAPRSPSLEPTAREFDTPVLAPMPAPELTYSTPEFTPFSFPSGEPPLLPPPLTPAVPPISPSTFLILPPYIGGPSNDGPNVLPPVSVPEPPTFLLLSLSGVVAGLRGSWIRRKHSKANQSFSARQ
jgi:hypothetical protein